jgi:transcriptional regulator GlxA family with amidase domain
LLIERRLLEQRAAALAGMPVRAVEFEPAIELSTANGRALQSHVWNLVDLAERTGPRNSLAPLAAADLRETLLGSLLHGTRHGLSDAIEMFGGQAETLPRSLRRVREYLHAHAEDPLDLVRLAEVAGIGIRALQLGFKRHFGQSISETLLGIRLAHLNVRLNSAACHDRITDIAFELGFTHLSRMATAYCEKFGETPSATRRRVR